jgi:A/G-specific adenine glycosylase
VFQLQFYFLRQKIFLGIAAKVLNFILYFCLKVRGTLHIQHKRAWPKINHLRPPQRRRLQQKLLAWYKANRRDLPWRRTRDPYHIWVSEVMLQQTQTVKVLEYYERFLEQFPNIQALAQAPLDAVLKVWEGMGYYARARNLHRAAQHLSDHWRSRLPRDYEKLLAIPGVGPYTAAAVASIAFNRDHAVVDGNVARVLCRWFKVAQPVKSTQTKKLLGELAQLVLASGHAGHWNQAMMELGARICTPRNPQCEMCAVQKYCSAFLELDDPAQLPVRPPRREVPHHHLAVGLVWNNGTLLIEQRQNKGLLGGLWQFPNGHIYHGETPAQVLRREIQKALDIAVEVGDYLMTVEHAYTHLRVTLHVYHCLYQSGAPHTRVCQNWHWVQPSELRRFAFPNANRRIIDRLLDEVAEKC